MSKSSWLALLVFLALPASVLACLWDYDTLKQERSRFPSTLELITGKFLRHSPEFYTWRIGDREKKLAAGASDPALYDDLAVAYQMTGDTPKAIATMEALEKLHPGRYETYSNLGTFHILAGNFEAGLPYIDKALAINPDAHFGREKYQKWLVEYAMTRRKDGKLAYPLYKPGDEVAFFPPEGPAPFSMFLLTKLDADHLDVTERDKAVKGILGMMRFANYRNPLLLEALANLLTGHPAPHAGDAKQLAVRAYLQASYQVEGPAREAYRKLAEEALRMQTIGDGSTREMKLPDVEKTFRAELADAESWYAELKGRELDWIAQGLDADAEFDRLYPTEPALPGASETWPLTWWLAAGGAAVLALLAVVWFWLRAG